MQLAEFLARCMFVDLETNENGQIYAIGAMFEGKPFRRTGRFDMSDALAALDRFAGNAAYVLGHNLLGHDRPTLQTLMPGLKLLEKPMVDTLYLSPLAFPENPYHRLVKDYKLVRDSLNDPVADACLAARIFADQWDSLTALGTSEERLLPFYHYCLEGKGAYYGLREALSAMGADPIKAATAFNTFQQLVEDKACRTALAQVAINYLPSPEVRPVLAYAVAWLRVAGGNSVLPPWVRLQFPDVAPILRQVRDVPCKHPSCAYCREMHDPDRQLERFFGFSAFRGEPQAFDGTSLQRAIVRHAMADRPVFAVLPTGGGKSLCYQLPALVRFQRRGVLTIVISPLQALMKDQVDNLRAKTGAPNTAALYGMLTPPERGEVLNAIRLGDIAVLYVSPEQLRNRSFRDAVAYREVGCWVFDEAHCLSKWGHDFRPDYLYAARFIKEFSQQQGTLMPPVQCFTATAKREVKAEILEYFRCELGQELEVFEGGVERNNLHFEVQMVTRAEKFARVHEILCERLSPEKPGSAVVYCATQKRAEEMAAHLGQEGLEAEAFHAGLEAPRKKQIQENFISGLTRVICATNAFGMGIDKDDVRLVIHADIPGSLENYLQEAGRAGRDRQDAECVLLYGEDDIETQFKLSALSQLSQKDISQILRGLRRATKRNRGGNLVITTGELLHSDEVATSFDSADRNAKTKVITAISWLERAGFLLRDENRTQVFQGRPLIKNMEQARAKIERLALSKRQRERWLGVLETLLNADSDAGFSADELAELPAFAVDKSEASEDREHESETQRVLRTLHAMAEAGLIRKSLFLNAFVRHKVANPSSAMLKRLCRLEAAMLDAMQEEAPDAEQGTWQMLSLRVLNDRLLSQGYDESNPEVLRNLLHSLSMDGQGLAGSRGSLNLRYKGQDQYAVKLQRDWQALRATAERRQAVAEIVLNAILQRIPEDAPSSADLLVEFAAEELLSALKTDMVLAGQLKDPLAAMDRALMFLHEQHIIILQRGLAVFRQAMTIRVLPQSKGRRYSKGDFEPLSRHYGERIFQVHVMNEYARKGLQKIGQALAFLVAYFSQNKAEFVRRYFAERKEMLARATSQQSFQRIVEQLQNPVQTAIVAGHEDDNMLILAGPGSGKTRVVVHRCAYLLRIKRLPPQSILVLCFNRNAVTTLRRRLQSLVGDDAKGVTVQTYHGLALRLSGHSIAARVQSSLASAFDFDALIQEAAALLRGEKELLGVEADEVRDRLLSGYRHILVDEYQDIDAAQYELISAIAGRTMNEQEAKLTILAVGDDDQNIYQFRGANVGFIRRFQEDYDAQLHYLVENYRSNAHIIAAANSLIARNKDRMKTSHPIRINRAREVLPSGGRWAQLDPFARGRVQCIRVGSEPAQARAVVTELRRLRQLDGGVPWSDCAVLAKEWGLLSPVRAICEAQNIPISVPLQADRQPPPFRIRENATFIEVLQSQSDQLRRASELDGLLEELRAGQTANPWWQQLENILLEWKEETANARVPVKQTLEFVVETLCEQRRERRLGEGVFLSTVHSGKGMEFSHVFILDGGWGRTGNGKDSEEERRLYYVAMTRAKETLSLMDRRDVPNPHILDLEGDWLLRRDVEAKDNNAIATFPMRYAILGMQDLYIGFVGTRPPNHPIHRHLAALQPGSPLNIVCEGDKIMLCAQNLPVAALSKAACTVWRDRLEAIESVRVLALIRRYRHDGEAGYQDGCKLDQWEVPMVEMVTRAEL